MAKDAMPKRIRLIFFSGTGGTEMAAARLSDALKKRGVMVLVNELDVHKPFNENEQADMLVVLFPVYACNAPAPVYTYIKNHAPLKRLPAAVISVSGGGEALINKASRLHTIRLLEKKAAGSSMKKCS